VVLLGSAVLLYAAGKVFFDAIPCDDVKSTSQGGPRQADRVVGGSARAFFAVSFLAILPPPRVVLVASRRIVSDGPAKRVDVCPFPGRWVTTSRFHPSGTVSSTRVWATVLDLFLGVAIAYVVTRTKLADVRSWMRSRCCRWPCRDSCWPSDIWR